MLSVRTYQLFRFFNTCPSTDPADVYFFPSLGYNHLASAECSSSLGSSPNYTSIQYNFTFSPDPGSNDQFFDAATIPKNGTDPLTNNPGGVATPVSGAVFTWSLYDGGVVTVNATVTTWTGAGATTLGSGTGSVTSFLMTTGTSGVSGSASATASSKSIGRKNSPRIGLLFMGTLLLILVL